MRVWFGRSLLVPASWPGSSRWGLVPASFVVGDLELVKVAVPWLVVPTVELIACAGSAPRCSAALPRSRCGCAGASLVDQGLAALPRRWRRVSVAAALSAPRDERYGLGPRAERQGAQRLGADGAGRSPSSPGHRTPSSTSRTTAIPAARDARSTRRPRACAGSTTSAWRSMAPGKDCSGTPGHPWQPAWPGRAGLLSQPRASWPDICATATSVVEPLGSGSIVGAARAAQRRPDGPAVTPCGRRTRT